MYRMGDTIGHLRRSTSRTRRSLGRAEPVPLFSGILATRAAWSSPATSAAVCWPTIRRPEKSLEVPDRSRSRSPTTTSWTESNMSRFCPASADPLHHPAEGRGCCVGVRDRRKVDQAVCTRAGVREETRPPRSRASHARSSRSGLLLLPTAWECDVRRRAVARMNELSRPFLASWDAIAAAGVCYASKRRLSS